MLPLPSQDVVRHELSIGITRRSVGDVDHRQRRDEALDREP
ncbi:MAG: hypothetical protein QOF73_4422, partial [Thermomicrobiales bacterium]|nr:hypothetical protein [Thermomicrobiales bacterium]